MKMYAGRKIIRFFVILSVVFVLSGQKVFSQCDWIQRADFGGADRYESAGFAIGNKGYIGLGSTPAQFYYKDFWEYRPATDTWTQVADFPGTPRSGCFSFVINGLAYVGAGKSSSGGVWTYYSDFYVYNQSTDSWAQLNNTPFTVKSSTYFTINGKGYVLCGVENGAVTDKVWEYNPATDTWTQKTSFPGGARAGMLAFTTSTRAFVGTGGNMTGSTAYNDFWEYNYASDTWTQKANFTGPTRNFAVGVALQEKWCMIMSGRQTTTNNYLNDVWSYDISNDIWVQEQDFPGSARYAAVAFNVNSNKAYFGTGSPGVGVSIKDFWEFTPGAANIPVPTSNAPVCVGSALNLYASSIPGATYNWTGPNGFTSTQQNAIVSSSATTNMSGNYFVTSTLYGCTSATGLLVVSVDSTLPSTPTVIQSGANLLSSSATGNQWYDQNGIISGATDNYYTVTDNGSYFVVVTNGCGYAISNTIAVTNASIENSEINMKIYPNPAADILNIEFSARQQHGFVSVFDVYGQLLKTVRLEKNKTSIDISSLSAGMYFLKITDDSGQSGTYCISKL